MKLNKQQLDDIFEAAETQSDYIIALFAAVVPRWDDVRTVDGFVHCGRALGDDIMGRAIAWDRDNELPTMPGGAWMNSGFSSLDFTGGPRDIELPAITYRQEVTS